VVTAEDVAGAAGGRFVLPEGAILTPLARDLLRRQGSPAPTARRPGPAQRLVVGNWKSYRTCAEARAFAKALREGRREMRARLVVCPPFTALATLGEALAGAAELGAQDVSPFDEGAHTGEVASRHLVELGARFAIVGHSERRAELGETDELVHRKARAALAAGIVPIVCVGETKDERAAGRTSAVVRQQVRAVVDGLDPARAGDLVIAYEPRWAIGAGVTPTDAEIGGAVADVRHELERALGTAAARTCVLYGGSVSPENAAAIGAVESVAGFLVGGASLDPRKLLAIAAACG
jgi:triosephosphate isomerase